MTHQPPARFQMTVEEIFVLRDQDGVFALGPIQGQPAPDEPLEIISSGRRSQPATSGGIAFHLENAAAPGPGQQVAARKILGAKPEQLHRGAVIRSRS